MDKYDEIELSLICCLFVNRDAITRVYDKLTPEMFVSPELGLIYKAACALFQRGVQPDMPLVAKEIQRIDSRQSTQLGGLRFLLPELKGHRLDYNLMVILLYTYLEPLVAIDLLTAISASTIADLDEATKGNEAIANNEATKGNETIANNESTNHSETDANNETPKVDEAIAADARPANNDAGMQTTGLSEAEINTL